MNEITQHIIDNTLLSVEQADTVFRDLDQLEDMSITSIPRWVVDLARHYNVRVLDPPIEIAGWRAAAKAYRGSMSILSFLGMV